MAVNIATGKTGFFCDANGQRPAASGTVIYAFCRGVRFELLALGEQLAVQSMDSAITVQPSTSAGVLLGKREV